MSTNKELILELIKNDPDLLEDVRKEFFFEQQLKTREPLDVSLSLRVEKSLANQIEYLKTEFDVSKSDTMRFLLIWGLDWYQQLSEKEKQVLWEKLQ